MAAAAIDAGSDNDDDDGKSDEFNPSPNEMKRMDKKICIYINTLTDFKNIS